MFHYLRSKHTFVILLLVFCAVSISWGPPSQAAHPAHPAAPTETVIDSNVTSDTTWSLANSPYHIISNIDIESGVTLTIEPGVEIWVGEKAYIHVREGASIIAKGSPLQKITITRYVDPETELGPRWRKIWFHENTSSYLRYVDLSYGGAAAAETDTILHFQGSGNHTLNNCTITDSKQQAIFATGSGLNLTIAGTLVQDNGRYAIIMDTGANVSITGSTFGAGDSRIWIRNKDVPITLNISNSNLLPDPGFYSIWNDLFDSVCVDAQNNWWGTTTGPLDTSAITDACGLYTHGGGGSLVTDGVNYQNWLTAEAPRVGITTPPTATLSVTPDPTAPQLPDTEYSFDASGSTDVEDYPASLEVCWDWDDSGYCDVYDSDRYTTTKTAAHVFAPSGSTLQTVRLVVRDTDGDTDEITQEVQLNGPPTAAFTMDRPSDWARVAFDASGSSDDVDPIQDLEVAWDYQGDDVLDVNYTPVKTTQYDYPHLGKYWPTLYVRDTGGLTDSLRKPVHIIPPATSGSFTDTFSLESVDQTIVTSMSAQEGQTLLLNGLVITHTPWLTLPYDGLPGAFIYQGFTLSARAIPGGALVDQISGTYTITVRYGLFQNYFEDVLHLPYQEHLTLYHWTEATEALWMPVDATLDMSNRRLVAEVSSFGHFALAMNVHQIYLPITVR